MHTGGKNKTWRFLSAGYFLVGRGRTTIVPVLSTCVHSIQDNHRHDGACDRSGVIDVCFLLAFFFHRVRFENKPPSIWSSERPRPVVNNSSVCSRVLPVCQHRPVRYPLGISTSAINQTMPAAAVKVSYVRTSPKKAMNHNAEFSLEQQTTYYSYIGSRFLIMYLYLTGFFFQHS